MHSADKRLKNLATSEKYPERYNVSRFDQTGRVPLHSMAIDLFARTRHCKDFSGALFPARRPMNRLLGTFAVLLALHTSLFDAEHRRSRRGDQVPAAGQGLDATANFFACQHAWTGCESLEVDAV